LALGLNQALLSVDLHSGRLMDRWDGNWIAMAASPEGDAAAVLDLSGDVHLVGVRDGHFDRRDSVRRAPVEPDGRRVFSRAIALDEDEVAIAGGGLVAIGALTEGWRDVGVTAGPG
jgi:hypothetical protein